MPMTPNATLVFAEIPESHTHLKEGVHLKVENRPIDLDNVPLNGGALLKTLILSSDPYMRYRFRDANEPMFCAAVPLHSVVDNIGVAKVVRSDDPNFAPGDYVTGFLEFAEYSVNESYKPAGLTPALTKVKKHPNLPLSAYLGPLGLPAHTAYGAWKAYMEEKVKTSKSMFVSSGAGAVGTFLIEYAKATAPHLKIIASAGSDEKVQHMKNIGVDVPFNYKTQDANAVLKEAGPIDIYFDNVGGSALDAALLNINSYGLIIACGNISSTSDRSSVEHSEQIFKRCLTIQGFLSYAGPAGAALATFEKDVVPLVSSGKITSRVHEFHGINEAFAALESVQTGANNGKAVIVVAED